MSIKHGICDILREKMVAYIESRDESVRWLSQRVALPYSSVYRIISREAHNCTFRNAYQILKTIAPDEAKSILVEYFPTFKPLIEQDHNFVENEDKQDKALELILQTRMLYVIHSMASNFLGTNRNEIRESYGRIGIEALESLLVQEILVERRDGVIKDLLFDTVQTNGEQLKQMIRYNLESLNVADRHSGIVNIVEGYSDSGAQQVLTIVTEAFNRLNELKLKPANLGKNVLFCSLVCGQFDAQAPTVNGVGK